MPITQEHEDRYGLDLLIARCDDCDHVVSCTRAQDRDILIRRIAAVQPDRIWREGMPIFCGDLVACSERTWQRYGRHMQALIDQLSTALPLPAAAALTVAYARQERQDRTPADAQLASWLLRLRLQLREIILKSLHSWDVRKQHERSGEPARQTPAVDLCDEMDCEHVAVGVCPYCQYPLCDDDLTHHEWLHGHTGKCASPWHQATPAKPAASATARQELRK